MAEALMLYCLTTYDNQPAGQLANGQQPEMLYQPLTNELAAVVGRVDAQALCLDAANLTPQQQSHLIELACWHDAVINHYAQSGPVLPVRFGAVFSGVEPLAQFVSRHEQAIRQFLELARTRAEWVVKLLLVREQARAWSITTDVQLAEQAAALPSSPGARYLLEKKLHQAADRWLREQVEQWTADLLAAVGDLVVQSCPITPTVPANDQAEPLAAWAMWLSHDNQPAWSQRLQTLQADWQARGLRLAITGPWPAYHFAPTLSEQQS